MEQLVVKSAPFHQQVYELIRDRVINGEYSPGERINEYRLSQELAVSRTPIREALRMLEQDELVELTPKGVIVSKKTFKDIEDIYMCRMAVEPFAAKLSADRLTDEQLAELKSYIDLSEQKHKEHAMQEVVNANTAFHDVIIESCGNTRLVAISDRLRALSLYIRNIEFTQFQRDVDFLDEHKEIYAALAARDGELVEKVLRSHIASDLEFYRSKYQNNSEKTKDVKRNLKSVDAPK